MELFRQARSYDTNHSGMPAARGHHDRSVSIGNERVRQLHQRFIERLLFDRLAIAILPIQAACQQKGLLRLLSKQKFERILGYSKSAGRIQSRADTEAN